MTEMRDNPEFVGGDITHNAIERLSQAGLSPEAQASLTGLWLQLDNDEIQKIKFAAGLLIIAESLESVTADHRAKVIPIEEALHRTTVVEVETQVVERTLPSQIVAPNTIPTQKKKASKAEQLPIVINKQADDFLRPALREQFDFVAPKATLEDVKTFARDMIRLYYSGIRRGSGRPPKVLEEIRQQELALFLDGCSSDEIGNNTGDYRSAAQLEAFREQLLKALHKYGFGVTKMTAHLEAIVSARALGGDATSSPSENFATVDESDDPSYVELTPEQKEIIIADMLNLCQPFWNKTDLDGLLHVIKDPVLTEQSIPARLHLRGLLASFGPHRGDGEVLERLEWDTINLLSGYDIPRDEKIRPLPVVERTIQMRHHMPEFVVLPFFYSGLQKLINRAAPEYQAGWYPDIVTKPQVKPPAPTASSVRVQNEAVSLTEVQSLVQKLCRGTGLNSTHIEQLSAHLGDSTSVSHSAKTLEVGLLALRSKTATAIKRSKSIQKYREDGGNHTNDILAPRDIIVLNFVLGDPANGRFPRSFKQLVQDGVTLQMLGANPEEMHQRLESALRKVDYWVR